MKLSYNWLQDYIDLSDLKVEEIAEKLTMGAFEVEEIEKHGDKLEGEVVLGEIKSIDKHPNADKLQITQTCIGFNDDGTEKIEQIVCGASNIAVGQKIPVATVGSKVVDRRSGGSLEIKKSKIRSIESSGMLCSASELGLSDSEIEAITKKQGDGIYILTEIAKEYKVGTDIRKVLGFASDYVFEVGARSNRGDALSIYGQARELSALFSKELKPISAANKSLAELSDDAKNFNYEASCTKVKPEIEKPEDCSVFYTCQVKDLKVTESPNWLKQRLEAMGQKSINNLVDVSNYVLLELGQPLHFYDASTLSGDTLYCKRSKGETFKTLDDQSYELNEKHLVIADAKGAQCLAGAMGGFDSQVTGNTSEIVIEAAAFTAASVRRSARAAGVESESKKRFERGVDKSQTVYAIHRAVELLARIALEQGQKITVGEIKKAGDATTKEQIVELETKDIKRYLGIEIPNEKVTELLKSLDIITTNESAEKLKFSIPSFRQNDITRAEDLIEEIGRLYGFDQIAPQAPKNMLACSTANEKEKSESYCKNVFLAKGFSQAILSSLVGDTLRSTAGLAANENLDKTKIEMQNPLSREHYILRQSMIPGLIQAASRNYSYDRSKNIKLFELGKVYFQEEAYPQAKGDPKANSETKSYELAKIAAIVSAKDESWQSSNQNLDFYYLKSLIEELCPRAVFQKAKDAENKTKFKSFSLENLCHPGIAAVVFQDRREIGFIAKIHPSIAKEWKLDENTYFLELELQQAQKTKFKSIASTPIIERDLTVDIPAEKINQISAAEIKELISKKTTNDFKELKLLSHFQKDKNSPLALSFRLKWQSAEETLSGEAIDSEVTNIKQALSEKFAVEFRA